MQAQSAIFRFQGLAAAQARQAIGGISGHHFTKANVALVEGCLILIDVQGPQGDALRPQGQADRVLVGNDAVAGAGLPQPRMHPGGSPGLLHVAGQVAAQMNVHLRRLRVNLFRQGIVLVQVQETADAGAGAANDCLEGLFDHRVRIGCFHGGRHKIAQGGQIVGPQNRAVADARGGFLGWNFPEGTDQ